jgi:GntR family transcriptional regulator / MocR family aminotransferase
MDLHLEGASPAYMDVYTRLCAAIDDGLLSEGARLPSSRELSEKLNLSRNTILRALDMLIAEGRVVSRPAVGLFVAVKIDLDSVSTEPKGLGRPKRAPPLTSSAAHFLAETEGRPARWGFARHSTPYDFRYGEPNYKDFPSSVWRRLTRKRLLQNANEHFDYAPPEGIRSLRSAIADHLRHSRGLPCTSEEILIVSGSQQSFGLIGRMFGSDQTVAVESPGYRGAETALRFTGCKIAPVPLDNQGMSIDVLDRIRPRPKLIVVTPTHQFPTGRVMTHNRRLQLIRWVEANDALIVEDDYDAEYRYDVQPLAPLKALDTNDRTLLVGTFSKLMFPGLRLGYIYAPTNLIDPLRIAKSVIDTGCPPFFQLVLADFLEDGHFDRYLRRARRANSVRRDTLVNALSENIPIPFEITGAAAGLFLTLRLPSVEAGQIDNVLRDARERDVIVYPVQHYHGHKPESVELILGYATLEESDIRTGIARLAEVFEK